MPEINTLNEWGVTAHGGGIRLLMGVRQPLSIEQARRLAAWLVLMADIEEIGKEPKPEEQFSAILDAIKKT